MSEGFEDPLTFAKEPEEKRFIFNEAGERVAVVLPLGEYEKLLELAEDAESLHDADEASSGIAHGEEPVPWESVRDRIGSEHDDAASKEEGPE